MSIVSESGVFLNYCHVYVLRHRHTNLAILFHLTVIFALNAFTFKTKFDAKPEPNSVRYDGFAGVKKLVVVEVYEPVDAFSATWRRRLMLLRDQEAVGHCRFYGPLFLLSVIVLRYTIRSLTLIDSIL